MVCVQYSDIRQYFFSKKDDSYQNILPTLSLLNEKDEKKLFEDLEKLDFNIDKFKDI